MAQIKKIADGKYFIRASHGTGQNRVYDNATFYGTRKEANEEARDMEIMLGGGKLGGVRFAKCFEVWKRSIQSKVAPRTLDGYEGTIRLYALPLLAGLKFGKIRTADIARIYDGLGHLSPTTVRNLHASLSAMFGWAVRRKDIRFNPCDDVDNLPAKRHGEIVVMDEHEAAAFADVCREMPNGLIFALALETGMRPEEYLALRWRDLSASDLIVTQAVQFNRRGGGYYFKDIKTAKGRRRLPISNTLRQELMRHRRTQNEHRLAMKKTWHNHDLIFPNEIGRPLALNNLTRRYFHPILERCGFEKHITLYALRHTMATILLMNDVHVKIVSERLGHATINITLDTYSHVLPHIQAQATGTMENVMRRVR